MGHASITDQFYLDLTSIFFDVKSQIVLAGMAHDLAGMQTLTLLRLNDISPHSMKDLCNLLHCDASNVTGIIDGLEQKGLVERRSDPQDRRVKTLHLLPAGKQLQQQILSQLVHDSKTFLASLNDEQVQQLTAIIQTLIASRTT